VARESGPDLDVHVVTHEEAAKGRGLPVACGARLGRLRLVRGWPAGSGGPVLHPPGTGSRRVGVDRLAGLLGPGPSLRPGQRPRRSTVTGGCAGAPVVTRGTFRTHR
jgi:hypothetical protein